MNLKKINIILGIIIVVGLTTMALKAYKIFPFNEEIKAPPSNTSTESENPDKVTRKSDFDSYLKKGEEYLENDLYELAINEFSKANKEDPSRIEPFIKIGEAHLALKNNGKARKNFETALEIDAINLEARKGLGESYIAERDIEEAKKIFEPLHVDDPEVKYYKGMIFAYLKEYEKSKEAFIEGMAIETASEDIKKKTQIFLDAYEEFERNKGGVEIHLQTLIAKAYTDVEEYQMAIPLLFEVLKEKTNYADAWMIMGYAYLKLDKSQDAIDAFEETKKLAPERAENLFFLGLAYFNNEDYDKAIENLNLALENEYTPTSIIKQKLAEIYVIKEDYEKASESYEELISINDNNIDAFIQPIWIYIDKLEKPEKALGLALNGLEKHKTNAMAHNLVGWAYLASNNLGKAKRYLIEAIKLDSQLDAAYLNLGSVYEKKNKTEIALKLYKKAEIIKRDPAISSLAQRKYAKLKIKEELKTKNTYQANVLQQ